MQNCKKIKSVLGSLNILSFDAEQIEEISRMYIDDIIDYLIVSMSDLYKEGIISLEMILQDYSKIIKLDRDKYPTIECLNNRLKWLSEMELTHIGMGLHESHVIITKVFNELNITLNRHNVEYYHTGGILAYLLTQTPFERFHHDIDVFVQEENFDDLISSLENSQFNLHIYTGKRSETTDRIVIKLVHELYPDIPISVFLFEKTKDNAIIEKDYYYDKIGNTYVEERYNCPISSDLSFDKECHFYNGIPYKSISLEALFVCKQGVRPKDIYDRNVMKSFVDERKVKQIEDSLHANYIVQKKLKGKAKVYCKQLHSKSEGTFL